ncbi:MAG: DMT family transporter [bacterium]
MSRIAALGIALLSGILMSVQPVINSNLGKRVGVLEGALFNFLVGGAALLIIIAIWGKGDITQARHAPWYLFTGGLMGVYAVTAAIVTVPKLGSAGVAVAILTGQMLMSMVIDYYGFLGLEKIPISPSRVAGVLLLFVGLRLISGKL